MCLQIVGTTKKYASYKLDQIKLHMRHVLVKCTIITFFNSKFPIHINVIFSYLFKGTNQNALNKKVGEPLVNLNFQNLL